MPSARTNVSHKAKARSSRKQRNARACDFRAAEKRMRSSWSFSIPLAFWNGLGCCSFQPGEWRGVSRVIGTVLDEQRSYSGCYLIRVSILDTGLLAVTSLERISLWSLQDFYSCRRPLLTLVRELLDSRYHSVGAASLIIPRYNSAVRRRCPGLLSASAKLGKRSIGLR